MSDRPRQRIGRWPWRATITSGHVLIPATTHDANIITFKGAITSKIKTCNKHKTSRTRLAQTGRYAAIGCKLKQNANVVCSSFSTVVQVLQDLFYILLHVLFYLWSLLNTLLSGRVRTKPQLFISLLWCHRVTWRHQWRHQSILPGYFPIGSQ